MNATPPDLVELLQGPVAREVLGVLMRGLSAHVRADGGSVPVWAPVVCRALADAADVQVAPVVAVGSGTGTGLESLGPSAWAPIEQAADSAGCSASYARRLARSGRVRARRVGARSWLIDVESLARVLRRTA